MGRLGERVAIVTGGAGDIGSAVARALAAEGASVVIADIKDPEGTDLAADLEGPARFVHLDVTSEDDWQRAPADTERELGPVSVLANIAGIIDWGRMEEQSPASFRRVVDVNLTGAWLGIARGRTVAAPGGGWCHRQHVLPAAPVTRPAGTGGTTPCPARPYGTCAGRCRSAGTSGPGRPGGR
ncbi:SDR family NAD(P)-dependent oxidoreductase [Streptomyces collinus]|uniref:SDR family NAD(P)-dependent oxidoreductase n=1 Tax=Streptomyces collinus TaxID=42684 RepID=UPI003825EFE1